MASPHLIPIFPGKNDLPVAPTAQAAGNVSHVIAKHNDLAAQVETRFAALNNAPPPVAPPESRAYLGEDGKELPYSGYGGYQMTDDYFYYLGSKGKQYTWSNPAKDLIHIGASSLLNANAQDLVKLTARIRHSDIATQDLPNSFIWINLTEFRQFKPTYIAIRQANTANQANWLKNFKLQGTMNMQSSSVTPDGVGTTDYGANPFNIDAANVDLLSVANEPSTEPWISKPITGGDFYSSFRIIQTGANNSGNNILQISEIELYGVVKAIHFTMP